MINISSFLELVLPNSEFTIRLSVRNYADRYVNKYVIISFPTNTAVYCTVYQAHSLHISAHGGKFLNLKFFLTLFKHYQRI